MTTHSGTVMTTRATVLNSNSPTRGRTTRSYVRDHPIDTAAHATYSSGIRVAATRIATVPVPTGPAREAFPDRQTGAVGRETGGATTYNNRAFSIRSKTFCASSVDGSTTG